MKKSYKNSLLLVFVSATLFVALVNGVQIITQQTSQSGKTVYVGPPPAPFQKIQEAIDNETTTDGDIIEVMYWPNNPYIEKVNVTKSLILRRHSAYPDRPEVVGGFNVSVNDVTISDFNITKGFGMHSGIVVYNCSRSRLERNNITKNYNGIYLQSASNCTLISNVLTGNTHNFGVGGTALSHFLHNIGTTNTINGKQIQYLTDQTNRLINSTTFPSIGYLGVVNSQNITIRDLSFQNNTQGVLLAYTNSSIIQNITTSNNSQGVLLAYVNGSIVQNVTASSNDVGICLSNSRNNTVEKSTISQPEWFKDGIVIVSSSDNMIRGNNISCSDIADGVEMKGSYSNIISGNSILYSWGSCGINVESSSGNIVSDNYLKSTIRVTGSGTRGIYLDNSVSNLFYNNSIVDNDIGIDLWDSDSNVFFHNNIYNSTWLQARLSNSLTIWELNGLEGNYWSDYTGADLYSGLYQNETGSDGIGDAPYPIYDLPASRYNNDTRPLMKPWNPLRIHRDDYWYGWGIWTITVTTFSNSTVANFTLSQGFKPPFEGEKAVLINVTSGAGGFCEVTILRRRLDGPFKLFMDDGEIYNYVTSQNETYYMPDQNETHSIFYLNFTPGVHHIKIVGKEFSLMFCDLTGDGRIEGKDLGILAKYYDKRIP